MLSQKNSLALFQRQQSRDVFASLVHTSTSMNLEVQLHPVQYIKLKIQIDSFLRIYSDRNRYGIWYLLGSCYLWQSRLMEEPRAELVWIRHGEG
jgi:hypothetical protein